MSTNVDDFGSVSKGLDRAQLHDASRGDEWSYSRPTLDAVGYKKPSIRQAFKDNLLSAIVHPRYGANKIKSAIIEKREGSKTGPEDDDRLPTLAPQPAVDQLAKDRLTDGFKEKPQLPPAKEFLHNPVASVITTVQDQRGYDAAENIIKAEVSHGADVQLLRQADKIENSPDGEEKEAEEEIFVQMKHLRQDAFVRWTIDRHVRVVAKRVEVNDPPPQRPPFFKDASADKKISTWSEFSTKRFKYELERHGQYYIDPEFEMSIPDRKLLASAAERLVVASTPLQSLVMKLLSVSHWEDPRESAIYMLLYFFLLFFSYITRAVILFVLLKVLYRGWNPPTLDDLRTTVLQAEDQDTIPQTLGELVIQYGQRAWTEHLIDHAGQPLFEWGERIADVLEMTRNFCEWRNPRYTGVTLSFLFTGFVVITITPTWLLVQMTFMFIGILFFILTPLAVRYHRYRVLCDPITWLLWRSPTHAEWAISRLQTEARQYLASDHKLKDSDKDTYLIGTYACNNTENVDGKLIVLATSVSFSPKQSKLTRLTSNSKNEDKDEAGWSLLFDEITEIHKSMHQNKRGGEEDGLEFCDSNGNKRNVMKLAKRDEVFSQIIGFSGVSWKRCG